MKKLVIKTIAFTIAIIVTALSVSYILFATLSPASIGDVYFRLNSEKMSLKYSVKAYEKSLGIDELATIVERGIAFKNYKVVDEYGTMLINDENYSNYVVEQSSGYEYYIIGSVAEAKYFQGYKLTASQLALDNTKDYTSVNPIRVVLSLAISDGDVSIVEYIKQNLVTRQPSTLLDADIQTIDNYLNSQGV